MREVHFTPLNLSHSSVYNPKLWFGSIFNPKLWKPFKTTPSPVLLGSRPVFAVFSTIKPGHIRCTCTLHPWRISSYGDCRWAPPPASKRKTLAAAPNLHPLSTSPVCPACSQRVAVEDTEQGEGTHRGRWTGPPLEGDVGSERCKDSVERCGGQTRHGHCCSLGLLGKDGLFWSCHWNWWQRRAAAC
jgi:hypothetical protein